jgi:hypothetical protein
MGARPYMALTLATQAGVLQSRAAPGDVERAASMRERALDFARASGLAIVENRLARETGPR